MDEQTLLATRFEEHRPYLRAIAQRMLGSTTEADDAVQEAWLRLSRSDATEVRDLRAWLTTVVSRVCLNVLRSQRIRREESLDWYVPDPVVAPREGLVGPYEGQHPEDEAVLADSVGVALLVVLETLTPAERLAFVLHDLFAVPFDEIAAMLERSPEATRQLASRARRRVRGGAPTSAADLGRQRAVVDAFFAAARDGDLAGLVAVLHPDVVLRSDAGADRPEGSRVAHGAETVARQAMMFARLAPYVREALVNGRPGVVVAPDGRVVSVMEFVVSGDRIVGIEALADPDRLARLDLSALDR